MSRKDGKKDKKEKIEDTMDAFAAEFLEKVQTREAEKPKIVQIIIYETSVWGVRGQKVSWNSSIRSILYRFCKLFNFILCLARGDFCCCSEFIFVAAR